MTFPKEIHRGAGGYSTMRLESYDLSVQGWRKWRRQSANGRIAESNSADGLIVITRMMHTITDVVFLWSATGKAAYEGKEFDSAHEAIAYHEELAKGTTDRLALMESHEVQPLAVGAL